MTEKGYYPVGAVAAILDLDARRVQQLAKQGVIPKGRRGQYHLVESVRGYIRFLRSAGEPVAEGALGVEQIRRMRAEASLKEMELLERQGDLVAINDITKEVGLTLDTLRSSLLAFTPKHAHEFVGLKTIAEATSKLEPAIHGLMRALSSPRVA